MLSLQIKYWKWICMLDIEILGLNKLCCIFISNYNLKSNKKWVHQPLLSSSLKESLHSVPDILQRCFLLGSCRWGLLLLHRGACHARDRGAERLENVWGWFSSLPGGKPSRANIWGLYSVTTGVLDWNCLLMLCTHDLFNPFLPTLPWLLAKEN